MLRRARLHVAHDPSDCRTRANVVVQAYAQHKITLWPSHSNQLNRESLVITECEMQPLIVAEQALRSKSTP